MAVITKGPEIVVQRNKLGTPMGVLIDGVKVPWTSKVSLHFNAKGVPEVDIRVMSQNIKFEEVDTMSLGENAEVDLGEK